MKKADTNKKQGHILRKLIISGVVYCALRYAMANHATAKRAGDIREGADDSRESRRDARPSYLQE
ncbi:MAG: hypothetical protein NC337_01210 [Roseburia sp.]|nr:hypothetical protein [Roseburia sp.]